VIDRQVRILTDKGYIETIITTRTQTGYQEQLFQLPPRAYLAIIVNQTDFNEFTEKAKEDKIVSALTSFIPTEA
jgi:hypothetical protein